MNIPDPSVIRDEYLEYNQTLVLPVKANDVAFGLHAVAACLITIVQCFVYDRHSCPIRWSLKIAGREILSQH